MPDTKLKVGDTVRHVTNVGPTMVVVDLNNSTYLKCEWYSQETDSFKEKVFLDLALKRWVVD